jgi:TRAP-type transport system periplasmic protein
MLGSTEMTGKGMDGKGMLQSANDLIKQYTK